MSVITVSRESGSGGRYIAQKVADRLGYELIDKNRIGRIFSLYGAGEFGADVGYVPDFWTRFDEPTAGNRERLVCMLNEIILAVAHQDNVLILGRSSFAVLAKFTDVLNVRIQAPLSIRIKGLIEHQAIADATQAEVLVKESDRLRTGFVEGYYGRVWDKCSSFDLVINTGKLSQELAINWICQAVEVLPQQLVPDTLTIATIPVAPGLATIVSEELNRHVRRSLRMH